MAIEYLKPALVMSDQRAIEYFLVSRIDKNGFAYEI